MLEFGVMAGLSARNICLNNTLDRKKSDRNLKVENNVKQSFDTEHHDAMPNYNCVETNNNWYERKCQRAMK